MATDLQGELSSMVQEMQNLEKSLTDLNSLVTESSTKMEQIEQQSTALVQAATNALQHHEEDLHSLATEIQTTAGQFKDDIDHTGEQMQNQAQQLSGATQKAFAAVDTSAQHAGDLDKAATQHTHDVTDESQQFEQTVKQVETSVGSRIEAATQTVTQGVQHLGDIAQKWEQKGASVAQSVGDALHKTTDEIDQKFIAPLSSGVQQFTDLTKQIADDVVSNPIQSLADQLKSSILQEAQSEIDAVGQQIQKVIEDAISALTDAGDSNDAVNKEVKAIFDELQPLWDQLTDALRSVQSIWDTVKSAVEAL